MVSALDSVVGSGLRGERSEIGGLGERLWDCYGK